MEMVEKPHVMYTPKSISVQIGISFFLFKNSDASYMISVLLVLILVSPLAVLDSLIFFTSAAS